MVRKLPNKNAQGGRIKRLDFLRQKLDKENLAAEREEKRNQNAILLNLIGEQQQMMTHQTAIFRKIMNKND